MNESSTTPHRNALWGNRFSWKRKAVFSISVSVFTVCTLLFFAPLEIYLGNIADFSIPFRYVWRVLLATACIGTFLLSVLAFLLPERVFWGFSLAVFGIGACSYVQALLFNFHMGTLTGEDESYSVLLVIVNLLLWVLLLAGLFVLAHFLTRRGKRATFMSVVTFAALALCTMQGTALIVQWSGTNMSSFSRGTYLTREGEFEVANERNVIEFIVDTCDTTWFERALEKYPDMTDNLRGFTYYPNATSTHSRTYPSVPYLLTGEICHFDKPMTDYIDGAWKNSSLLSDLKAANCDVRLFTPNVYVSEWAMNNLVENVDTAPQGLRANVSVSALIGEMAKMSFYREAPYLLKPYFIYEGDEVSRHVSRLSAPAVEEQDIYFYSQLTADRRLTVSDDYETAYRFYHLYGAHPGSKLDADGSGNNTKKDQDAAIRGCFRIIEEYIAQLQALGLYEQSTIIITADHGCSGGTKNLEVAWAYRPVMIVKPAGIGADAPYAVSQAPVCHADLFATVWAGVSDADNPLHQVAAEKYGKPIWEYTEDSLRDRFYYYTALRSDKDGEVVLREYRIVGDAGNLENWFLTGRYWDVNFSERAVSHERFNP